MSITRKRSAAHKAFLPEETRDNQYILAEFAITDELIDVLCPEQPLPQNDYYQFYHQLSEQFFALCQQYAIASSLFIANDKLVRVRFNHEMHQWQTNQQIIFYYDPAVHEIQKSFYDSKTRAKKVTLLFLATGQELRVNAAGFHEKVRALMLALCTELQLAANDVRLRDHQHLTYDLFSKHKQDKKHNQAHKLRHIPVRYASQGVTVPDQLSAMTYAVINLPITQNLLSQVEIDPQSKDPYNPLYAYLTDKFTLAAQRFNLNNGAMIANGLIPIVRFSLQEIVSRVGELQMLGYNPALNPCGIISKWDASMLVDNVQLIFVATEENCSNNGYGRFLNQIELALKLLATELEINPAKEELIVRFHQHIAYNF